jgi:hypothetical protein
MSTGLLGSILFAQNKLGSETKDLYERSLDICYENCGPEGVNTAASYGKLSIFLSSCQTLKNF